MDKTPEGLRAEIHKVLAGMHVTIDGKISDSHKRWFDYYEERFEALLTKELQRERDRILAALPQKRTLIEPVTKRVVTERGDKVGIDLDVDRNGSLIFIQDNGFNMALDQVTKAINNKEGGENE